MSSVRSHDRKLIVFLPKNAIMWNNKKLMKLVRQNFSYWSVKKEIKTTIVIVQLF